MRDIIPGMLMVIYFFLIPTTIKYIQEKESHDDIELVSVFKKALKRIIPFWFTMLVLLTIGFIPIIFGRDFVNGVATMAPLILIGFIPIIFGLYFFTKWVYTPLGVLDGLSIREAFSQSNRYADGYSLNILGAFFILILMSVLLYFLVFQFGTDIFRFIPYIDYLFYVFITPAILGFFPFFVFMSITYFLNET